MYKSDIIDNLNGQSKVDDFDQEVGKMNIIRLDDKHDLVRTVNCWELHRYNSRVNKKGGSASPNKTYYSKLQHACESYRDSKLAECKTINEILEALKKDNCICKMEHNNEDK